MLRTLEVTRCKSGTSRITSTATSIRLKLSENNSISENATLINCCLSMRGDTVLQTYRGQLNAVGMCKPTIAFYTSRGKHVFTFRWRGAAEAYEQKGVIVEKTIILPADKFERAVMLDRLLSEGWTVKYDKNDDSLATVTKTEINEDFGRPMLLLD